MCVQLIELDAKQALEPQGFTEGDCTYELLDQKEITPLILAGLFECKKHSSIKYDTGLSYHIFYRCLNDDHCYKGPNPRTFSFEDAAAIYDALEFDPDLFFDTPF